MADQTPFSRPYRSKRDRPCDLCRVRKVGCKIVDAGPCMLCQKSKTECTFVGRPVKRPALSHRNSDSQPSRGPSEMILDRPGSKQDAGQSATQPKSPSTRPVPPGGFMDHFSNDNENSATAFNGQSFSTPRLQDFRPPRSESSNGTANQSSPEVSFPAGFSNDVDQIQFDNLFHFGIMDWDGLPEQESQPGVQDDVLIDPALGISPEASAPITQSSGIIGRHSILSEKGVPPAIASLDQKPGFNAVYFGLSNESDPYLLRRYRYDNTGEFFFFKIAWRQTANDLYNNIESPLDFNQQLIANGETMDPEESRTQIPVQFRVSTDELADDAKADTAIRRDISPEAVRQELDELIPPEDGRRLVGLFFTYVFPALPIVSRSQLNVNPTSPIPTLAALLKLPTHLAAAIYASALAFTPYDDRLCVSNVYKKPPANEIWRIVFEEIFREIHTPHLSVIQAALLYIQKPRASVSSAAADTPFRWSFMASIVGLANSLALHIDCQDWSIPWWEKRLRRRLWWTVYTEEKFRSLLGGFPALINKDHWDVSNLTDDDFAVERLDSTGLLSLGFEEMTEADRGPHFRHLASLAAISDDIYLAFYTLRTTRKTSNDFVLSLSTAQPLRYRLQSWYSALPESLRMSTSSTTAILLNSNASLHLAYFTLETLLYRALLRPLGRSRNWEPPRNDVNKVADPQTQGDIQSGDKNIELDLNMQVAAEAAILAAENCARLCTKFVGELGSRDFSGFWYSWSRIGFATMSNFVMLLIIQAPNTTHAVESKQLADNWRQTLRFQSKSFDQMNLGMLRIDAVYWSGMDKLFIVEPHVQKVL